MSKKLFLLISALALFISNSSGDAARAQVLLEDSDALSIKQFNDSRDAQLVGQLTTLIRSAIIDNNNDVDSIRDIRRSLIEHLQHNIDPLADTSRNPRQIDYWWIESDSNQVIVYVKPYQHLNILRFVINYQ